jgi:exopolysaccharide biosynthesis WecB/TagA/CpsF family protein
VSSLVDPILPPSASAPGTDADTGLLPKPRDVVDSVQLLGTRVDLFPSADAVIERLAADPVDQHRHLCYVNAHSLNLAFRDIPYRQALGRADFVLNDGIGVQLAARMQSKRFPENLNGSDFTMRLLALAAERGWRVFLYGGRPGVADSAREQLMEEVPGLDIVGACDGYTADQASDVVASVRAADADLLIVALGQPNQELWLDQHLSETGCHLGVGVGAFLDFAAGLMPRAPQWMNRIGAEWLFRLVHEPRRLWSRYVVGNPTFLWRAWRTRRA